MKNIYLILMTAALQIIAPAMAIAAPAPFRDGIRTEAPTIEKDLTTVPSNPSTGYVKSYIRGGSRYILDSTGNEILAGGTAAAGNILKNFGFDEVVPTAGYTVQGTLTANPITNDFIDGKRSVQFTSGGASVSGTLVSRLVTPSNADGLQFDFGFWFKTLSPNIQICAATAGVAVVCQGIPPTGKWSYVVVPASVPTSNPGFIVSTTAPGQVDFKMDAGYVGLSQNAGVILDSLAPTQQRLLSGSGTYTTPAGVKYLRIRMVGGGGGGGGGTTGAGGASSTGGGSGIATTFGTSLLTANGGFGGNVNAANGGQGGGYTINAPAYGVGFNGGGSTGTALNSGSGSYIATSQGGASMFGGSTLSGFGTNLVSDSYPNSGTGGPGGGCANVADCRNGAGGGAGAGIDAYVVPTTGQTFSYTVGAGGGGGNPGTSGGAGRAGGSGLIIVDEYYNASSSTGIYKLNNVADMIGTVTYQAAATCPAGSVIADGTAVSRTGIFAALFSKVGVVHGAGDGTTTFNLPNALGLFGRFAGGQTLSGEAFSTTLGFRVGDGTAPNNMGIVDPGHGHDLYNAVNNGSGSSSQMSTPSGSAANQGRNYNVIAPRATGVYLNGGDGETRPANIGFTACIYYASSPAPTILGGISTRTVTTAYTASSNDEVIFADPTTAAFTLTLPPATTAGKSISITRVSSNQFNANLVTVTGSIGGTTRSTVLFAINENIKFVADGTTWQWVSDPMRRISGRQPTCGTASCAVDRFDTITPSTPNSTRSGVGAFGVPFISSSLFSAIPLCNVTSISPGIGTVGACRMDGDALLSGINVYCASNGGAADYGYHFSCSGPR